MPVCLPAASLPSARPSRTRGVTRSRRRQRPGTEERAADPHHRGALLDRRLEVARSSPSTARAARARRPSSRSAANQRRGSPSCGRHGHQAVDVEPERRRASSTSAADLVGRAAALLRLAARFTSTSTGRPGRGGRCSAPSAGRSTDASTRPTARAPAPCCAAAARRSASVGGAGRAPAPGALASSSWARFSPRSVTPGGDEPPRRAPTATVLVAATSVTVAGIAPGAAAAAAMRSRTSATTVGASVAATVAHVVRHHDHAPGGR